eukprot:gene12566-15788_t
MPFPMRKLGSSGLEVPVVCLGTMTFGEQNTQEEGFALMDLALKRGAFFWDTAELYPAPGPREKCGLTEEIIGNYFKARGCREKVVIATKVAGSNWPPGPPHISANRTVPKTTLVEAKPHKLDAANIKQACAASLRRLQTDYIDLYQLHWPDRYVPKFGDRQYRKEEQERDDFASFEEQVQSMGDLIKEGKVRHWGLSNETAFGVCKMVETAKKLGVPPPITIQNDFSLLHRCFEEETAAACAPRWGNVSLLAWGPLAGEVLTGKYLGGQKPAMARHTKWPNACRHSLYHCSVAMEACTEYADLAKRKGLTLTQMSLQWCASRWFMGSTIMGATSLEQLKENLDAFEGPQLDDETLMAIDAIDLMRRSPTLND